MTAAVVDTMVFAYALLNEPQFREDSVNVLARVDQIHVPDSFKAEFCNVAWQWVTHNRLSINEALSALNKAESLIFSEAATGKLWQQALEIAVYSRHPAYDTLFITLAEQQKIPLITYDKKLLRLFPDITQTPVDFLNTVSAP